MRIKNGTLLISKTDFDHIMGWSDNPVHSDAFIEGLCEEIILAGLEKAPMDKIILLLK